MSKNNMTIEVIDILGEGKCSMEQKTGGTYSYPEDREKMCPSPFYILYPWIMVMYSGGSFTETGDGSDFMTVGYSDYRHQVMHKIVRTPEVD